VTTVKSGRRGEAHDPAVDNGGGRVRGLELDVVGRAELRPVRPSDWAVALVPLAVPGLEAVVTSPGAPAQFARGERGRRVAELDRRDAGGHCWR